MPVPIELQRWQIREGGEFSFSPPKRVRLSHIGKHAYGVHYGAAPRSQFIERMAHWLAYRFSRLRPGVNPIALHVELDYGAPPDYLIELLISRREEKKGFGRALPASFRRIDVSRYQMPEWLVYLPGKIIVPRSAEERLTMMSLLEAERNLFALTYAE